MKLNKVFSRKIHFLETKEYLKVQNAVLKFYNFTKQTFTESAEIISNASNCADLWKLFNKYIHNSEQFNSFN